MKDNKYVPKEGDIVKSDAYRFMFELWDDIDIKFYKKGHNFELVGLSLDRIKERDEKLIITLKEQFYDLYHQIGKVEVWREGGSDVFCDLVEKYINKQIDKVFAEADKADVSREAEVAEVDKPKSSERDKQ